GLLRGAWHEADGFFSETGWATYGDSFLFRVRSFQGFLPLFATEVLSEDGLRPLARLRAALAAHEEVVRRVVPEDGRAVFVLNPVAPRARDRLLGKAWDTAEFLSPFGLRSLSKYHETSPFWCVNRYIDYEAGEAQSPLIVNTNWRGPIWLPINFLMIESLAKLGRAYRCGHRIRVPGRDAPASFGE